MLAAVYRGIDQVTVEEVPVPQIGSGEVLVRIRACGVCGTDLKKIRHGLMAPPRIFGHEMAGDIVRAGEEVDGWSVGDRVAVMHHVPCLDCRYCRSASFAQCPEYKRTGTTAGFEPAGGGFAQYIRVMDWIVRRGMARIPPAVSYEMAALIEPVNTCLKAAQRAGMGDDQTVLVMGQGPIGLIFTRIFSQRGCRVISTDPLQRRRELSRRFGASLSTSSEHEDVLSTVKRVTDGIGVDVTVLTVPESRQVPLALEYTRPGGKTLLFAQTRPGDFTSVDAGAICAQEKDLIGSYSSDIYLQDRAAELIYSQAIPVTELISHRLPLERIQEAIELAGHPSDSSLKVMVLP
jgi:L-iditol 2-dehydrogenase